jgi:amino acid transporter
LTVTETAAPPEERQRTLSLRGATVLGVGSMIGAGIFSLLGEAGTIAGAAVWISFLAAGVVAGLLGYVCSKLGMKYPSSGGLVEYLAQGFGLGRLVGITAWLGYISAVVVVTAMVAVSFGDYAVALFVGHGSHWSGWDNVFISLLLVVTCALNMVGTKAVAAAQAAIVVGVLAVFGVFIFVTVPRIDTSLLAFSGYPSASKILASVTLTFFAFLGFSVITFTAGDLKNPRRDLPRAMGLSLGITTVVYVLIAIGVFGTLTVTEVIGYGPTAIAEAARPALGDAGFKIMAVAALLSTAGCTNACLYASDALTGSLAGSGLFPAFFGPGSRLGRHAGLLITTALVLIIANLATLGAIASVGSAVSMVVFLLVGLAGWRRRHDTASNPAIVLASMAAILVVLVFFAIDTIQNAPETFAAMLGVGALAVVLDQLFRRPSTAINQLEGGVTP